MKKVKNVVWNSWAGGRYWDRWMPVHFLSGLLIGQILRVLNINYSWLYIGVFGLLVLWEIFEEVSDIFEPKSNSLIDVALGMIGFVITFEFIPELGSFFAYTLLFIFAVLSVTINFIGWRAWLIRVHKSDKRK